MPAQGNALGTGIRRKRMPCKGAAILGYCDVAVPVKNRILFRPHRARTLVVDVFPGRCPGLICDCPVRGEDPKAQHQIWRVGLVQNTRLKIGNRQSPRGRVGSVWSWTRPGGKWHSPGRRVFVLRGSEFRPEGETTSQPRATPWEPRFRVSTCPVRAPQISAIAMSQSPVKNRILFRPVRARAWLLNVFPGRCPGLICGCPFGTSN
jgi:hypothetical protein